MIGDGIREALSLLLHRDETVMDAAVTSLFVSVLSVAAATLTGVSLGLVLARRSYP